MKFALRRATLADVPELERLIAESARGLSRADYTDAQIEAALGTAFGVDSELIRDGTYFVAEANAALVACGGWSRRRTLFGGDRQAGRTPSCSIPLAMQPAFAPFSCGPIGRAAASAGRCSAAARPKRRLQASWPQS